MEESSSDPAALGEPRDAWEAEMFAVVRRELEKARNYEARAQQASAGTFAPLIGQADNCRGYAEAIMYAVRRRRELAV